MHPLEASKLLFLAAVIGDYSKYHHLKPGPKGNSSFPSENYSCSVWFAGLVAAKLFMFSFSRTILVTSIFTPEEVYNETPCKICVAISHHDTLSE